MNKFPQIILAVFFALVFGNVDVFGQAIPPESENRKKKIFTQTIVVTEKRLSGEGKELDEIAANTIVITSEQIKNSGAETVQELLSELAGIIFYDQAGNGRQTTVGLRGFSDGTSTTVYVDGVRVNDPLNNSVNLEYIDPATIERIEITPGGASNSRGNGAMAGTIDLITKSGRGQEVAEVSAHYGSFSTFGGSGTISGSSGGQGYFMHYNRRKSDGYRENGQSEETNVLLKYNFQLSQKGQIEFVYRRYSGDIGNPGALTQEELASDRHQAPYNLVDYYNSKDQVLSGRITQNLADSLDFSLLVFTRDLDYEILGTGRSAAIWGGIMLDTESKNKGMASQLSYNADSGFLRSEISIGFDYSKDDFNNTSHFTTLTGAATSKAGDTDTTQEMTAFFSQGAFTFFDLVTLSGSVRSDSIELSYRNNFESRNAEKTYRETTASAGATLKLGGIGSLYASYSESFQAPTVNELFAFPLFGSNPDLFPTTGKTYEGGLRVHLAEAWLIQSAFYRMDLENEVIYVITNPIYFLGQNQNVGESRRSGFEMTVTGYPSSFFDIRCNYNFTISENLSLEKDTGLNDLSIPLVPRHKATLSANLRQGNFRLGGDFIYVGEQVLDSDPKNSADPLEEYFITNFRFSWKNQNYGYKLEIRNALDAEYSTRGILAYGQPFLTPAMPRAFIGSVEIRY